MGNFYFATSALGVVLCFSLALAQQNYVTLEGCGNNDRVCMVYPADCLTNKNCIMGVTIRPSDPADLTKPFIFEMAAQYKAYVATALAESNGMGKDSVVACVNVGGKVQVSQYQNPDVTELPDQKGVTLTESNGDNGVVSCVFQRDSITVVGEKTYDLSKDEYILEVVAGNSLKEDNTIAKHDMWLQSNKKVKVSEFKGQVTDIKAKQPTPTNHSSRSAVSMGCALLLLITSSVRFLTSL